MGGSPCKIIIIEGNVAYAVVEVFSAQNPDIEVAFLEAAINASCDGIDFSGLYEKMEMKYISNEITNEIIMIHTRIINELPTVLKNPQKLVDELTDKLFEATRKLYQPTDFIAVDLNKVRASLNIK